MFSIILDDSVDMNGTSDVSPTDELTCPFGKDKAASMYPQ